MTDTRLRIYGREDQAQGPTNGKRWWKETWGKGVGTALGAILLVVFWWTWGVAVSFKAATVRAYQAPARVDKLEAWKASLPAPQAALPPDVVKDLRDFLQAQKKSAPTKARP